MTRQEVFLTIKKVVRDCIPEMDVSTLSEETILAETEIESMGFILIICRLEALFGIQIPESEWQKLSTIGDVVDAILERSTK